MSFERGAVSPSSAAKASRRSANSACSAAKASGRGSASPFTHVIVNKQLDAFLWVVELLEPLEELSEEWGGLLNEDANQNQGQYFLLHSRAGGEV